MRNHLFLKSRHRVRAIFAKTASDIIHVISTHLFNLITLQDDLQIVF